MNSLLRSKLLVPSAALLLLLGIQFYWLFETASLKEKIFNEKVSYALGRAMDDLCTDAPACTAIESCCDAVTGDHMNIVLRESEKHTIDSLIRHYLAAARLHLDYSFVMADKQAETMSCPDGCYIHQLSLKGSGKQLSIRLELPDKKAYLLSEMGVAFVLSVLLLVLIVYLFLRLLRTAKRQQDILEHTKSFVDNMTHELKTPLTNIAMAGRLLAGETIRNDAGKRNFYGRIIREETEKLRAHIDRMLQVSALENDGFVLERTSIVSGDLLREVIQSMHLQAQEKNIHLLTEMVHPEEQVTGDVLFLSAALLNLIDNAIKYAPENSEVRIHASVHEKRWTVSVTDQGPGIPIDQQELVFEKYYRVPDGNVHNVKGFGLGLFFVRKIAELHGGSVTLDSAPGKGTTLTFMIPIA